MTLPNFLIIGAQKSGTTWLNWKLRQHPEVYMPVDEVHYFDREENYARGVEWYEAHFSAATTERAIGDKTPDYLAVNVHGVDNHSPNIHKRIHQLLSSARLMIVLRNPVERAVSAAYHMIRMGYVSPFCSIDDLLVGPKKHLAHRFGVLDYGRYYDQISSYLDCFDRRQVFILLLEEDIIQNPAASLQRVCSFLYLDPTFRFSDLRGRDNAYRHSRLRLVLDYYLPSLKPIACRINRFLPVHKPEPTEATVRELYTLYAQDNEELFDFLGRRPASWLTDN